MSDAQNFEPTSPADRLAIIPASRLGREAPRVRAKDGRSAESVLLRRVRMELKAHCGGKPSATQRALIERAAILTMHLARMDAAAMAAGGFSDHASRQYLAWSNTLTRTLSALGLDATPAPSRDLRAILADRAAGR